MDLKPHIHRFRSRFLELEKELSQPNLYDNPTRAQEITREHARLKELLAMAQTYERFQLEVHEAEEMLQASDEEMRGLAEEELVELRPALEQAEQDLQLAVLPPDPSDSRNTIVEIRAGTGGDEAALFAANLFRMYQRYAERKNWKTETMEVSQGEMGGLKEVIFEIHGEEVFKKFRHESGVHRVQRVPVTEAQGRIHTSTATVAVLPEAEEVDIAIKPEEIRVDITRSGGPGGQGVNTTDSCVQITHLSTGMIVRCQDSRSQHKNKDRALSILRSRLLEAKQREEQAKYAENRRSQIGTGDRNEKIRTYNFPQNRITDHRINFTTHNLEGVLDGELDELFHELIAESLKKKLAALEETKEA